MGSARSNVDSGIPARARRRNSARSGFTAAGRVSQAAYALELVSLGTSWEMDLWGRLGAECHGRGHHKGSDHDHADPDTPWVTPGHASENVAHNEQQHDGDRIRHMTKIWNDGFSLKQLGWA